MKSTPECPSSNIPARPGRNLLNSTLLGITGFGGPGDKLGPEFTFGIYM